jgi:asparagine synthase (glutamine-hydrolysing)
MCGIAGFLDLKRATPGERLEVLARAMADSMLHRGPDAGGVFVHPEAGLAISHRRLSIVDLSPAGAQPMTSADGRFVIVYNGEIYTGDELRRDLAPRGIAFRGHSDTEAILEGCAAWGVDAVLPRLIGMFAFALWDKQTRTLTLVRDRLGIKPVYWGRCGDTILFGSELKSLRAHPAFSGTTDPDAVASFLRFSYVPAPYSIYRNIYKLAPGHTLTIDAGGNTTLKSFWNLTEITAAGQANPDRRSREDILAELEPLMHDAVSRRMIADVPLGAFLSGGIDSSLVVALMQKQSARPVRTFTIGFHQKGYNEAEHAKKVAQHLGTEHTELYVDPAHAQSVIPRLPEWYDEPFADSSQIPTFLVSEMTRKHVTVALSGDGGDEIFAGYTRYLWAQSAWRWTAPMPQLLRQGLANTIRLLPPHWWEALGKLSPRRIPQVGERIHKVADVLPQPSLDLVYRSLVSQWQNPQSGVAGGQELASIVDDPALARLVPDPIQRMQMLDMLTYLPDDILTKVDRASMAVSLEARVPLLDHRIVEFAARVPTAVKMTNGQGKWLMRQILYKHVPRELIERPKQGFGIPVGAWLRGPLRAWGEDLLDPVRLRQDGYFQPEAIRQMWDEHQSGRRNRQYQLWGPLMFQAWLRHTQAA